MFPLATFRVSYHNVVNGFNKKRPRTVEMLIYLTTRPVISLGISTGIEARNCVKAERKCANHR